MKSIFTLMLASITTAGTLGQGTVDFRNYLYFFFTNRVVDVPFFDELGVRLEGPRYVAQLYFWKADTGFHPAGSPVAFDTKTNSGYFFGGKVLLPGVVGGAPAWVQVRAWDIDGGATFEQAALTGAWTGLSEVLFLQFTGCDCVPPIIPPQLIGLQYPGSPIIVRQPQPAVAQPGEIANLAVIASSGVQMSYQWYQQPNERPDGLIPGATNATYTTPALNNTTTFWVSVSNSAGSVLSDKATVTVVADAPRLTLERAGALPVLSLDGLVGFTYRIEYSTNLSATNWTSLVELSLRTSPFTFNDSGWSNSPARFYRAVAP